MGAKSYMTNGLLIYSMVKYWRISSYIRKPFLRSHVNFLIYEENFVFFFISVVNKILGSDEEKSYKEAMYGTQTDYQ